MSFWASALGPLTAGTRRPKLVMRLRTVGRPCWLPAAIVTGIYVGTKPGSRGPAILDSFGLAVAHIEQGASGQKISK